MAAVRLIVVTDGDDHALRAVEQAGQSLGLRVISRSAGLPTPLTGRQIVDLCLTVPSDPVLVMVDDHGHDGQGLGEKALTEILSDPRAAVLGVLAVASDSADPQGLMVDASLTRGGQRVAQAVDKAGRPLSGRLIYGDTLAPLRGTRVPVLGVGDLGKMDGADSLKHGARITRAAIAQLLKASHQHPRART